jgi:hypothetical protein
MFDGFADFADVFAVDEDFAGLKEGSSVDLEQTGSVQDDGGLGCRRLGQNGDYEGQGEGCDGKGWA